MLRLLLLSAIFSVASSIYEFKVPALDGANTIDFSKYKGKKIMIVNTASKCGNTPQYAELEQLYEKYKDKLVIIGFPANNFGAQEPGTNTEIKEFCTKNYGVTFQMMEKISVKGNDMDPVYKWLTEKALNGKMDSSVNDDSLAASHGLEETAQQMYGLAIHGGAGTLPRADMSEEQEKRYRAGLAQALTAGYAVLESGGTSLDAVTIAVVALEDNPLFNAGHGAVFTLDGRNELDASIMDGSTLQAGAICGVTHIKNPVTLARAVMEQSDYVLLSGAGAEEFALTRGFEFVPQSYFFTSARWGQLERIRGGDTGLSALTR